MRVEKLAPIEVLEGAAMESEIHVSADFTACGKAVPF